MDKPMRHVPVLLAALAVAAAGCSAENSPTASQENIAFDAPRTEADLEAIQDVFQSEAWQSFRAFGERVSSGQSGSFTAVGVGDALESLARLAGADHKRADLLAQGIMAAVVSSTGNAAVPTIPPEVRGLTFVLDPETLQYVPDPERTGAPVNGIRYILYAVNPVTGGPVVTAEIGHADLTDEGDALPTGVALRLQVISQGVTFLDYAVGADATETTGSLSAVGFVRDPETRLLFDIAVNSRVVDGSETVDIIFHLSNPVRGFAAEGRVSGASGDAGESGRIELTVQLGDDTIGFTAEGTEDNIDATFTVNGRLFAHLNGDPGNPRIRGEGNRPLSPEEMRALQGIAALTGAVLELMSQLLQPAGELLGFGAG